MTSSLTSLSANIIVSSGKVWRWQLELVQALASKGIIEICEVISNDQTSLTSTMSTGLLQKCDAAIFRSPLTAFDIVDAVLLDNKESDASSEASKTKDILINLSEYKLGSTLVNEYKLGVIDTHFSEQGELSSSQFAIREYLDSARQVYFSLVLNDSEGRTSLLSASEPSLDKGSLSRNLNQYFQLINATWKRELAKLSNRSAIEGRTTDKQLQLANVNHSGLSMAEVPKLFMRFACHIVDKLSQKYRQQEQWVLLLQFRDEVGSEEVPLDFSDYVELTPPADVFWADPLVITDKERHFVFFEELPFNTEKGHLSCMEVFKGGSHSTPRKILEQLHHLSFPNVFCYESTYYMIPETGDNGAIDLYQCTDFPYQWERKHTLMDELHAYDSTLIQHEGYWWLFTTVAAEKGMSGNEELHIFYADNPLSTNWKAHQANPVISDASKARPAGQFFNVENTWYRPSQDCAGHYGAGLNINKVITLNTEEYIEQLMSVSRPDWSEELIALHTLNFNNEVAVADALRVTKKGTF